MATHFYREDYLQWVENGAILNENVTSLSLGNEYVIRELTDSINNLPNLDRIVLAGSETITAIPSSVASLNKLKLLELDRTTISTLPEELRNFKQNIKIIFLKILHLNYKHGPQILYFNHLCLVNRVLMR